MKYYPSQRKYSSNSSNIVILTNKCPLCYHDLKVFQEGKLLLGRVLLLGEIWYVKYSSITCHSKAMANVKVFVDKQTDRHTGQKLYAPDLSMQGHKNPQK